MLFLSVRRKRDVFKYESMNSYLVDIQLKYSRKSLARYARKYGIDAAVNHWPGLRSNTILISVVIRTYYYEIYFNLEEILIVRDEFPTTTRGWVC